MEKTHLSKKAESALYTFLNEAGYLDEESDTKDKTSMENPSLSVGWDATINTVLNSLLPLADRVKSSTYVDSDEEGFKVEIQFKEPKPGYFGQPLKTVKFSLESYPKTVQPPIEIPTKPHGSSVNSGEKGTA